MSQTSTPLALIPLPSKDALVREFQGKSLSTLRTPAFVIDRAIFTNNCARMHEAVNKLGISFRAHLKTHKTDEGTRLQLITNVGKTNAVVVSTLMEAWNVCRFGLVAEETVSDLLYGMPVSINKVADLSNFWDEMVKLSNKAVLRILVDHPDQLDALEAFEKQRREPRQWSLFVKVDAGYKRAGLVPSSENLKNFIERILKSQYLSLYGFYCHAGDSYSSKSATEATSFLTSEIEATDFAAKVASGVFHAQIGDGRNPPEFVLSVGSTPTAHAADGTALETALKSLHGKLELHAGNYPLLDLQQVATKMVDRKRIAHRVLGTIVSVYPGRGPNGEDEAMCDVGAIALSKDTGPSGGFGEVIGKEWNLVKISQEHGILRRTSGTDTLRVGEQIQIIGQHACLIAAAYPWYYIVDSSDGAGDVVVDIWVPWKGW